MLPECGQLAAFGNLYFVNTALAGFTSPFSCTAGPNTGILESQHVARACANTTDPVAAKAYINSFLASDKLSYMASIFFLMCFGLPGSPSTVVDYLRASAHCSTPGAYDFYTDYQPQCLEALTVFPFCPVQCDKTMGATPFALSPTMVEKPGNWYCFNVTTTAIADQASHCAQQQVLKKVEFYVNANSSRDNHILTALTVGGAGGGRGAYRVLVWGLRCMGPCFCRFYQGGRDDCAVGFRGAPAHCPESEGCAYSTVAHYPILLPSG